LPFKRRGLDQLGELSRLAFGGLGVGLDQQKPEFVAAQPADHVAGAHAVDQQARDLEQRRVACGVAVAVVDLLQIVEVEIDQAAGAAVALGKCHHARQFAQEGPPVGDRHERIFVDQPLELAQPRTRAIELSLGLVEGATQPRQLGGAAAAGFRRFARELWTASRHALISRSRLNLNYGKSFAGSIASTRPLRFPASFAFFQIEHGRYVVATSALFIGRCGMMIDPLYSLSGFIVGALVGMTGVGGGSLMTPLLILLFGIHPATAVGTDLLYAAATKTGGTFVHGFSGSIDWRIVRRLATGSLPTTALTLLVLSRLGIEGTTAHSLILVVLGCALFATAGVLIFRKWIVNLYAAHVGELDDRRTAILTISTGAVLGVLVSISSVGAGALGATVLVLLYPKLPTVRIVGSDIAHAVPLTLLAGMGHWIMGSIDTHLLGSLLVGSIPGIVIGSYGATRVPDAVLRFVLAGTLILAGSKLIF